MRYSESLNNALHEIMQEDETVYLLGEDICDPYGGAFKVTKGLSTSFPDRVINTPISESAIVGIATGMAMQGLKPIVEIMFGDFLTLCTDQIVNGATKFVQMFDMPIPLIIRAPMGGYRGYGPTHSQSLEALFLHIPNLSIVYPSIYHNPGHLLKLLNEHIEQPTLFIEAKPCYSMKINERGMSPLITVNMEEAGNSEPDITIITYGNLVPHVIQAIENVFMEEEIHVNVNICSQLDIPDIDFYTANKIIIAEESKGWGELMANVLYQDRWETLSKPISLVQSKRSIIPSAKYLENQVLPQVEDIERAIYGIV